MQKQNKSCQWEQRFDFFSIVTHTHRNSFFLTLSLKTCQIPFFLMVHLPTCQNALQDSPTCGYGKLRNLKISSEVNTMQ